MKKLYLLLTNSLIVLASVSTLTTTVSGCHAKEDPKDLVSDALSKFDQKHPLEITFDKNKPKPYPSETETSKKIKYQLKIKNKSVFTEKVLQKIKFSGKKRLKKDESVLVQATYDKKKKATPFYIKSSIDVALFITDELAKYNTKTLEIPYLGPDTRKLSDKKVTDELRKLLSSKSKLPNEKLWKKMKFAGKTKDEKVEIKPGWIIEVMTITP